VELIMTPDPLAAVLDQLAATREHLTSLDNREVADFADLRGQLTQLAGMIATINRALTEDTAAMARLEALERQVTELIQLLPGPGGDQDGGRYRPRPAPAWWKLPPADRQAPLTELRDWVDRVYRSGYGHLADRIAPCWPQHDLCLYALDIASQLWCALYLQPTRTTALLSAQAEYQVRILPAIAAQLAAETTGCGHTPATRYGVRRD
jgi:hypothetical protein